MNQQTLAASRAFLRRATGVGHFSIPRSRFLNFDDVSKLGIGLVAIGVLYKLLAPLIASLIASQSEFVKNMSLFATTLQGLTSALAEMRADLHGHSEKDERLNESLLRGDGCRYDPPPHETKSVVVKP